MRSKILLFLFSVVLAVGAVFGVVNLARRPLLNPVRRYTICSRIRLSDRGLRQAGPIYGSRGRHHGFD